MGLMLAFFLCFQYIDIMWAFFSYFLFMVVTNLSHVTNAWAQCWLFPLYFPCIEIMLAIFSHISSSWLLLIVLMFPMHGHNVGFFHIFPVYRHNVGIFLIFLVHGCDYFFSCFQCMGIMLLFFSYISNTSRYSWHFSDICCTSLLFIMVTFFLIFSIRQQILIFFSQISLMLAFFYYLDLFWTSGFRELIVEYYLSIMLGDVRNVTCLYYFSCTKAIKPLFLFLYFIGASLSENVVAMHIFKLLKLYFAIIVI